MASSSSRPTSKKSTTRRKPAKKTTAKTKPTRLSLLKQRTRRYLARRPHRSFRRTRRRDYARSLKLPGYIAFTSYVWTVLVKNRKIFIGLVLVYAVLSAIFIGIASQDTYQTLSETLRATSGDTLAGNPGKIGQAALLLASGATGSLGAAPSQVQQVYSLLLGLMAWLTTVWLLRTILAGHKPKLRDGLYSAGSPIIASLLIGLLLLVQLLPFALAVLGISSGFSSGYVSGGVGGMVLAVGALLLITLSLYWITSTLIAMVVVTLPGMYPMAALKAAGDLVIGRRLRVLLRWLWLGLVIVVIWSLIMIPIILLDAWIKGILPAITWLPVVPVSLLLMSSITIVFAASYIYLLYRRIVDDDAAPA